MDPQPGLPLQCRRDPRQGPQVGQEAVRLGALWQRPLQPSPVRRRELGRAAQRPAFPRLPALPQPRLPLAHRGWRHPQPPQHLGLRHPLGQQFHAALPPPLHRRKIPSGRGCHDRREHRLTTYASLNSDLYSLGAEHPEYFADAVHYNAAGKAAQGALVAKAIAKLLK